ncbi:MAG: GHKL domain-containing protein [Clostridiales bacterium]|nr:GHKL domain-containing protein [Clostridiales bacterium]
MESKNRYIILTTMLVQVCLLLIIDFTIINTNSLDLLKKSIPAFNAVIFITTILMLASLKKADYFIKKETELELLKSNMKNTEDLLNLLRTQRHDYLGHIQAIESLVILNEYQELAEYIKGIGKEYRITNEMIRLGNPILTAIINTKKEIAEKKGISFHVKCKNKVSLHGINSWELSSVISNLIENAIEEAAKSEDEKWIKINISYTHHIFTFNIENTGKIDEHVLGHIFEPGISTKSATGRGYGLYIVKNIVEKYNGTVEYEITENGTVKFKVVLPSEEESYGKKAV